MSVKKILWKIKNFAICRGHEITYDLGVETFFQSVLKFPKNHSSFKVKKKDQNPQFFKKIFLSILFYSHISIWIEIKLYQLRLRRLGCTIKKSISIILLIFGLFRSYTRLHMLHFQIGWIKKWQKLCKTHFFVIIIWPSL